MRYLNLLLFIILLLVACQSQNNDPAPLIVSSIPANNASDVSLTTKLSLQFSKAMNPASVKVTLSPSLDLAKPVWNSVSTVVFEPVAGWEAQTSYTVSIEGTDTTGNPLSGTNTFTFQTIALPDTTPPAVPSNLTVTEEDSQLTLSWQANTEADLWGYNVYFGLSSDALENGTFVAHPASATTLTGLENGKTYFFAIDAEDKSGNRSEKSSIASATPKDLTPPSLVSTEPAHLSQDLSLVPTLRLSFSEAMDTSSVEIGLCVNDMPVVQATCDAPVSVNFGTPLWTEGDTQVRFTPTDQFQSGKTHVLLIVAKDKAGNALSSPNTMVFSIQAMPDILPPELIIRGGLYTEDVANPHMWFRFSEAMNQQSVEDAFISQPEISCSWIWEDAGTKATCTSRSRLRQSTLYTITLGTGAKDTADNALAEPYQFGFYTGNFAPQVLSFSPSSRFGFPINVSPTAPIVLTFSEPMDKPSTENAFDVSVGFALWPGTFEWNSEGDQMTYRPTIAYGSGVTVTWTLSSDAKEFFGGRVPGLSLQEGVGSAFSTRPVIGSKAYKGQSGGRP